LVASFLCEVCEVSWGQNYPEFFVLRSRFSGYFLRFQRNFDLRSGLQKRKR
jgi:hypothetical protein